MQLHIASFPGLLGTLLVVVGGGRSFASLFKGRQARRRRWMDMHGFSILARGFSAAMASLA